MTIDIDPPREPTARTPEGIAYGDVGSGPVTLLFLPGWCGPRTLFEPLTSRLSGSFRALTVDWRGHGDSAPAAGEFGMAELADDAESVIVDARAGTVVPVSIAHAGWIAIELRRRLGPDRVPAIVLLDWMVLGAPPPFLQALATMSDPATTRSVVDHISEMWEAGLDLPDLSSYVASMVAFPDAMWARAAQAIGGAFGEHPVPLEALGAIDTTATPTIHLYAQPDDPGFQSAQSAYADAHPWFSVERLEAASHFPMFETPDRIADGIQRFLAAVTRDGDASPTT